LNINALTELVIGAAIEVHRALGPGLLESTYANALAHELTLRGVSVEREKQVQAFYKGKDLGVSYRLDLFVEGVLVVELKAIEKVTPVHHAQVRSYLYWVQKPLGLLLNFNVTLMKDGVYRVAHNLKDHSKLENWKRN